MVGQKEQMIDGSGRHQRRDSRKAGEWVLQGRRLHGNLDRTES